MISLAIRNKWKVLHPNRATGILSDNNRSQCETVSKTAKKILGLQIQDCQVIVGKGSVIYEYSYGDYYSITDNISGLPVFNDSLLVS